MWKSIEMEDGWDGVTDGEVLRILGRMTWLWVRKGRHNDGIQRKVKK